MLFQCWSRACRIFAGSVARISRFTIITMSRAGNRCWFLRKLSRNSRFSALRFTALGTCFLAIANPRRGLAPLSFATRIVIQASLRRILFLNTCWKSIARVNLSRLGKDSLIHSSTLRRQTCSTLGPTRAYYAATAAGLHPRAKPVRSGTLNITGLIRTFHVERLGLLFVDFNKARQCTVSAASRQYLIEFGL